MVNEVSRFVTRRKVGATSRDIGSILVERKLSKRSILESADKLRRARDHANNASLLGLLVPTHGDHGFAYQRSIYGRLLSKYRFEDECPKDLHESAVFTDRMMRLKLTNAYDSRYTYKGFHCRPFLNVLTVLRHRALHIAQIHHLLSVKEDISDRPDLIKRILNEFAEYPAYDEESIDRFMEDFRITTRKEKNEIGRSTKPLLDWAQQASLLGMEESNWCFIREKGLKVQRFYKSMFPIWFDQFDFDPAFPSALLLTYMYGFIHDCRINPRKLGPKARTIVQSLEVKFDLWNQSLTKLRRPVDFDLNYDVPLELRKSVLSHIQRMKIGEIDTDEVSLWSINQIEDLLSKTRIERIQGELGRALGIGIPRRECFQTNLEWQTCIRLRLLQLPAFPYQGEFEGETDLPMAKDNPDAVIKNDIRSLVECKSSSEWGKVIVLSKRIGGELHMYQAYAEDIEANSAVFVCDSERFDDKKFIHGFARLGDKLDKIVLVTWSFLDKVQKDQTLLRKLVATIEKPEAHSARQRILV